MSSSVRPLWPIVCPVAGLIVAVLAFVAIRKASLSRKNFYISSRAIVVTGRVKIWLDKEKQFAELASFNLEASRGTLSFSYKSAKDGFVHRLDYQNGSWISRTRGGTFTWNSESFSDRLTARILGGVNSQTYNVVWTYCDGIQKAFPDRQGAIIGKSATAVVWKHGMRWSLGDCGLARRVWFTPAILLEASVSCL